MKPSGYSSEMDDSPVSAALASPRGRAAVASGDLGGVVKLVRQALHLRQADLAARSGYSQATVSRAEQGQIAEPTVLADLCDALEIPSHILASSRRSYSEDMQRRDVLKSVVAAASAAMLPAAVADLDSGLRIGSTEIDECWAALRRLQAVEAKQGGVAVFELTASIAARLQSAVGGATYGASTGRRLREVTAIAAVRTGWQAFDSSRRHVARHWWLEARNLADLGDGADEARVMALAAMALPARDGSRGHETVGLAQAARAAAGGAASPKLLSLLAAREAIGHASVGNPAASAKRMLQSRKWLDQSESDAPPWLAFWGPGDLAIHEMHCALAAKQANAAVDAAREAVRCTDPEMMLRNHAIYTAYLGNVLATAGRLDESISVTQRVISSGAMGGSHRIAREVRSTARILAPQQYEPARAFAANVNRLVPSR